MEPEGKAAIADAAAKESPDNQSLGRLQSCGRRRAWLQVEQAECSLKSVQRVLHQLLLEFRQAAAPKPHGKPGIPKTPKAGVTRGIFFPAGGV